MKNRKVFVSWSGGKESVLSLFRTQKQGADIRFLLNMANTTGRVSRSHGIPAALMQEQADAMGITLVQGKASWNSYEQEFKKTLGEFKEKGIKTGVFGDIDLDGHRGWVERVCSECSLRAYLPLWQGSREDLMNEFIGSGFRAVVVVVNTDYLGKEWLGREIDRAFVDEIKRLGNVDICGEKGEFHTFVYDGPIFKKPARFAPGRKIKRNNYSFLELR